MMLNTSGKVVANYWLSHVYPAVAGQAHRNGDLHIHDLDMFAGYCAGWSLKNLLQQGFSGVPGAITSGPPGTSPPPSDRSSTSWAPCRTRVGQGAGVLLLRHLHGALRRWTP